VSETEPGKAAQTTRRMFALHSWLGFKLFLLMTVISLTGTLAVFAHEIDWLITPDLRVTPQEERASLDELHAALNRVTPEVKVHSIGFPGQPWRAGDAYGRDSEGKLRHVYFDPYTAEVQGVHSWITVQRVLRDFHQTLFLPTIGRYVVCAFGIVLLGSVVTGLIVYKKFWRHFFRLRTHRGIRVLMGDLHKLLGVWGLWFLIVMAVTGIWYMIEQGMIDSGHNPDPPRPTLSEERRAELGAAPEPMALETLAEIAREEVPGLTIRRIYLPDHSGQPVAIWGQTDAWLVRDRANAIYLDPFNGEVLTVYDARSQPAFTRWVHTADPVHFGDFAGLISKTIWFLFGAVMTASSITGAWLYLRRINRARPSVWRKEAPA